MARLAALTEALKEAVGNEFVLVELTKEGPKPIYDGDGMLLTFRTGAEASVEAERLTDQLKNKVQPRRAVDKEWRKREEVKSSNGDYQLLPWAKEAWWAELAHIHADHFPHVSLQKTALVAFTEDSFKGSADIQTTMKPGRYLERYFTTVLNKHVIRDLCCIFAKQFEDNKLQFADTPEEMEDVYINGPTSCMSKEKDQYKAPVHPCQLYAAGDLQVAYLRREGRIVARAIVWPEKKIYNTIYGDKGRLEDLLRKAGYKSGAPYGARLLKHKVVVDKNKGLFKYVCPHVDNVGWVSDDGEFLRTGKERRKEGEGLEVPGGAGFTEVVGHKCGGCGKDHFAQRHIVSYMIGETNVTGFMCKPCTPERLVICNMLGAYIEKSAAVEMVDKGEWGWTAMAKHGKIAVCSGSGKFAPVGSMILMPDGSRWSQQHFMRAGKHCEHCGGGFARSTKVCPRCEGGTLRSTITQVNTLFR